MKSIVDLFGLHLDGLQQTVALVDDLKRLGATSPAVTTARTRLGQRAIEARGRLTASRHWEAVSLDGCVLYLSAQFELAARDLAQTLIERIAANFRRYADLPESIRTHNLHQIGELLRSNTTITAHIDRALVVRDLASALYRGRPVRLHSLGFAAHDRNLRSQQLAELYARAGLEKFWPKIGLDGLLAGELGTTPGDQTATAAVLRLNSFMDERDQIAHRGPSYETAGATVVMGYIAFFRRFVPAVANVLDDYLSTFRHRRAS